MTLQNLNVCIHYCQVYTSVNLDTNPITTQHDVRWLLMDKHALESVTMP